MLSSKRNLLQGALATSAAFAASAAAAASALLRHDPRPALAAAMVSAACGVVAGTLGILIARRVGRLMGILAGLRNAASASDPSTVDMAALVRDAGSRRSFDSLRPLDSLIETMNDDVASLQSSAVKFDLFSSDILFSARNLAGQSETQLSVLAELRSMSRRYFEGISAANEELQGLIGEVASYAAATAELRNLAANSKERLSGIFGETTAAADGTRGGTAAMDGVADTSGRLQSGLRDLNVSTERGSAAAHRIGETLQVLEDIVERTHVLATNASIEAARAGTKGAGFAVIASEVRKLSESSRDSLGDIAGLLRSIAAGADQSAALAANASAEARRLDEAIGESRALFESIGARVFETERGLSSFSEVFSGQIRSAEGAAASAEKAAAGIGRFAQAFSRDAADYESIAAATGDAESRAAEAKRSAQVLAQLSGYLRSGGRERNGVLRKYVVDKDFDKRRFGRKERREALLYNLEIRDVTGSVIGVLGDLSPSGLLILADRPKTPGDSFGIEVMLPLSTEGERSHFLRVMVRRCEEDYDQYRMGCSFPEQNADERSAVQDLLGTLAVSTLTAGEDCAVVHCEDEDSSGAEEAADLEEL